jgi:uncharacterized protein (DUF934 family)
MLVKDGRIAEDTFTALSDDAPLPDGPVIVSLKRFLSERDRLLARNLPVGVRLETSDTPESLGEDVHRLALVELMSPISRMDVPSPGRASCAPAWAIGAKSGSVAMS